MVMSVRLRQTADLWVEYSFHEECDGCVRVVYVIASSDAVVAATRKLFLYLSLVLPSGAQLFDGVGDVVQFGVSS